MNKSGSKIVSDWLNVYQAGLVAIHTGEPAVGRQAKTERAKANANASIPEGADCLMALARGSYAKAGDPTDAVDDPYSVGLGSEIVQGIKRINREVLGKRPPKQPRGGEKSTPALGHVVASAEAPAPEPELTLAEFQAQIGVGAGRTIHRPSQEQFANLVKRYVTWADMHDAMPQDTELAAFTEWGRTTWARVRAHAEALGYRFEVKRGGTVVTARPEPEKATGLTSDETALLKKLIAKMGAL